MEVRGIIDTTVLNCPIFKQTNELVAVAADDIMSIVPFVHLCRDTCVFEENAEVEMMKEGKRVKVRKPLYRCDRRGNPYFVLNAYSFYTPYMDSAWGPQPDDVFQIVHDVNIIA